MCKINAKNVGNFWLELPFFPQLVTFNEWKIQCRKKTATTADTFPCPGRTEHGPTVKTKINKTKYRSVKKITVCNVN